jgi:hypothetical protein
MLLANVLCLLPRNRDLAPGDEHGPIRVVDQDGGSRGEESSSGEVER